MPLFNGSRIKDLKDYLYYSNVHDAKIEVFLYDRDNRQLVIETTNSIHNVGIHFAFEGVRLMLSTAGRYPGCHKTILSLTVEEDDSYLRKHTKVCDNSLDDSLYLLFQMFSGDELHVVADKVFVEIVK